MSGQQGWGYGHQKFRNDGGRNKKKKGKGGVPEGWIGCPSMSSGFIDNRFFVFKTPLKPELNGKLPQSERFSMDKIFEQLHHMNNSTIGLWIDLTNTSRYYDASEVMNRGVQYEKFFTEGHGKPPSGRTIHDFCGLVNRFFKGNRYDYVGVHCTHGFNRTGFLICCYLIRFRKYTAEESIMEFMRFRQPGIYRQSYVDALYMMSYPLQRPLQVTEPPWLQQHTVQDQKSQLSTGNETFQHDSVETTSGSRSINHKESKPQTATSSSASSSQIPGPSLQLFTSS